MLHHSHIWEKVEGKGKTMLNTNVVPITNKSGWCR